MTDDELQAMIDEFDKDNDGESLYERDVRMTSCGC